MKISTAIFIWSGGREARQGTANPSTRVQIPSRPPLLVKELALHTIRKLKMSADESVRPWGRYEVLQESGLHKVKCIYVLPGKRLSYQRHQKRREHWFIVSGVADVVLDGVSFQKRPGETVDVEIGQLHRIGNQGSDELVFIEIQTGTYSGEDDIERIEDDFSR